MASRIMDILSWKNKQESGVVFLSVNLMFYLIVLGGYSLISILSSIALSLILVINIHSFLKNQPPSEDDDYLYLSRESLEEVFVVVFDAGRMCSNKIHKSLEDGVQVVLGLLIFSWMSEIFGAVGLMWISTLVAFALTPQYFSNQSIVDSQVGQVIAKIQDAKRTVFEIIPKYKSNN